MRGYWWEVVRSCLHTHNPHQLTPPQAQDTQEQKAFTHREQDPGTDVDFL